MSKQWTSANSSMGRETVMTIEGNVVTVENDTVSKTADDASNFVRKLAIWSSILSFLAIIGAITAFAIEWSDRDAARVREAWRLVSQPAAGNAGKRDALMYLHRKGEYLVQLNMSDRYNGAETFLADLHLTWADLIKSDFSGSLLHRADLSHDLLNQVNFSRAHMQCASLSGADLTGAVLNDADLQWGTIAGGILTDASLTGTILTQTDVSGVDFTKLAADGKISEQQISKACADPAQPPILPQGFQPLKPCAQPRQCPLNSTEPKKPGFFKRVMASASD
jgi:hypothetical protein